MNQALPISAPTHRFSSSPASQQSEGLGSSFLLNVRAEGPIQFIRIRICIEKNLTGSWKATDLPPIPGSKGATLELVQVVRRSVSPNSGEPQRTACVQLSNANGVPPAKPWAEPPLRGIPSPRLVPTFAVLALFSSKSSVNPILPYWTNPPDLKT
jgi:hypothetical protein